MTDDPTTPGSDEECDIPSTPKKLGWRKGPEDPRTLKLSHYLTVDLEPAPTSVNWAGAVAKWPMLGNDRVGDCVPVSYAHHVQNWSTVANKPVLIAERDVVKAYSAISGYDPRTGRNDVGCESIPALNYWRRVGIGGRKLTAYVQINHRDHDEVKTGMHLFGGLCIAALLPIDSERQFDRRQTWVPTRGRTGRKGSLGGHAMHCGAYDDSELIVATWARTQKLTWSWWDAYVVEAYAAVSVEWLTADGKSPTGLNLDGLLADLKKIGS